MDIYLIRHTRPDVAPGICYGRLDLDLPENFAAEVRHLPLALPAGAPIVSGDTRRCRRLAAHLAAALHGEVAVDDRLNELDFGRWEGQAWQDIPRVQTDAWAKDIWHHAAPDGETYAALYARVGAAWESMLVNYEDSLVVVGHAGPLRALITIALELPVEAFIRIHLDYGGLCKLSDSTGGWRLEFANR